MEIAKNVTAETLMSETVKKVRRGSIVYTDKWKGYDSLMFSDTSILISIIDINSKKEKSSLTA